MREIKFRCWDKEKEIWTNYAILDDTIKGMDKYTGVWFVDNDRFLLQQYTGLKDRNGNEIYEGDICIVKFKRNDDKAFIGGISCIDRYGAFFVSHSGYSNNQLYAFDDYQVIGNICENLELLKV